MRFGDLATFDSNNKNKNQIITQNKVIMAKKSHTVVLRIVNT